MAIATRSRIVSYLRTSTADQSIGIDAQRETVSRIARDRGCDIEREYVEHESGGNNERAELDKAIRHARRIGAVLVVAKLDRLARDAAFLMQVYDGDVPIVFGDLPEVDGSAAGRLMVQMMAMIAEFERRRIGERTREALAALKANGKTLGNPANLTPEGRAKGNRNSAAKQRAKAQADMADVAPIAATMRAEGASYQAIANRLNGEGYVTRRGGEWMPTQVMRILQWAMSPNQ